MSNQNRDHFLYINFVIFGMMLLVFVPMLIFTFNSENIHVKNIPLMTIMTCLISILSMLAPRAWESEAKRKYKLLSLILPVFSVLLLSNIIFAKVSEDPSVIIGAFGLALVALCCVIYFLSSQTLFFTTTSRQVKLFDLAKFIFGAIAAALTSLVAFEITPDTCASEVMAITSILVIIVIPMQFSKLIFEYFEADE